MVETSSLNSSVVSISTKSKPKWKRSWLFLPIILGYFISGIIVATKYSIDEISSKLDIASLIFVIVCFLISGYSFIKFVSIGDKSVKCDAI